MTKFIPKLQQIPTKFSGSESQPEQTSGKEAENQKQGIEGALNDSQTTPTDTHKQTTSLEELGAFAAAESENTSPATTPVVPAPKPETSTATTKFLTNLKQVSRDVAVKLHIPQSVLDSPWLDVNNPLYRTRKFWITTGAAVTVGGGALAIGGTWWYLERNLPSPNDVLSFVRDGTVTIKAEDGKILQQLGPATREKLPLEQMPPQLVQAFIASEDRRYYQHKGVDWQGVGRAFVSNITARNVVEGGSTITQQLARIVFLNQERSIQRKLQEVLLAQKIEKEMNKDKILDRYLNLVYLGEGAYGVADAAWVYFSKPLNELTLPEMATIVGVTPAPSSFSPIANPKIALERRNLVLNRMADAGFITKDQAQTATASPLDIKPAPPKRLTTEAAYFNSFIQQELPKYVSQDAIEAGGLTIETTLNPEWQKAAEEAVQEAVKDKGESQGFEQAALVAIDPRNGQIKAMVGGTDFENTQFNRVTQAQRQPGSTFKGFLYTAAIAGGISPYRGYLDAPFSVDDYTPKNFNGGSSGWISMRDALTQSINIVAVKVLINVGFQPVIDVAHKMGIKSELKPTYSLALGASEVNLLELTNAYGTFAAKGVYTPTHGIRRIIDQQGKVIYEANIKPEQAIDADTASIMTWMLQDVVNDGTGRPAQLFDRQVAGKTGTSDEARDLWFVGYIPQLVTGVWLGNDDNAPTLGTSATAARTWNKFMVKAVEKIPIEKFPERPKLEGRKGTIALLPIQPGKMFNVKATASGNSDNEELDRISTRRSRRQNTESYRSTRSSTNTASSQTYRPRRRSIQANTSTETTQTYRPRRRSIQANTSTGTTQAYRPRRRYYQANTPSPQTTQTYRPRRRYSQANTPSPQTTQTYRPRRRYSQADTPTPQTTQTYRPRRRYSQANTPTPQTTQTNRPRRRYYQPSNTSASSSSSSSSQRSRRYSAPSSNSSASSQPVRRRSTVQQSSSSQSYQPRRSSRRTYSSNSSSTTRYRSRSSQTPRRGAAPAAPSAPAPSFELNSHQ